MQHNCVEEYQFKKSSSSKLVFIRSERLWGDFEEARKLKSIPDGVREGLSSFCKGGDLQKILYDNWGCLGDESGQYVCHVFNDKYGNLIANYFDGSSFDFDNVLGKFVLPTYLSDCYYNCSEDVYVKDLTKTIGYLLNYCGRHNISDVFIVGDDNIYNSFDAYVIENRSSNNYIGVNVGDYTMICIKRSITLLDELHLPVESDYAVYDEDSVVYADEVEDLLNQ